MVVVALDIHKVRQLCKDADRNLSSAEREVQRMMGNFRNLGPGFTGDRLYSREYQQLDSSVKEVTRALAKVQQAIKDISRKA